jgi:protein phosphatase methylesterase 1
VTTTTTATMATTTTMAAPTAAIRVRPWSDYWTERLTVPIPERRITFNVYASGPQNAPVTFFLLHGGGYTGVTWSLVARELGRAAEGEGAAAATTPGTFRVLAPDLRGHGLTVADDEDDLSAETLRDDVLALWRALAAQTASDAASSAPRPPPATTAVVIVGHSMSGNIAVRACAAAAASSSSPWLVFPGLAGCVVVDVVEGTALAALPHMRGVLSARPVGFDSREDAARWALRSGATRCREAAEVSAPTQVVEAEAEGAARGRGQEEEEEQAEAAAEATAPPQPPPKYVWRTPLERSSRHWEGWYRGLSAAFLEELPPGLPRALILAGADRLDRALTIGQMQGRFQLVLVAQSGHAVQEDAPGAVASALVGMARRFRMGEAVGRGGGGVLVAPGRGGNGGGLVLPVAAGPLFPLSSSAAARRGPGGTTALEAGAERRIGGRGVGGGGAFVGGGAIDEEEEEGDPG